jgi:transposase
VTNPVPTSKPTGQAGHRRRRGSAGGRPPGFDTDRYARRKGLDRGFGQLEKWRGLTARYDEHARDHAGASTLAALLT